MSNKQQAGLEVLAPVESVEVELNGKKYLLSPVRMGSLKAFAAAVQPLVNDVLAAMDGGDMFPLISEHGDKLIDAVAIGSGIAKEELESALPDEFIKVAAVVIRVNGSFFVSRLLPQLKAGVDSIREATATAKSQAG